MKSCLIIDDMHPSIIPLLEKVGWRVDYRPDIIRNEVLEIIHHYEGLIVRSKTEVDQEMIGRASQLRWIARAGAGLDQLNLKALEERNIRVVNAPEGNRDALAEHAIALLLALFNKIHTADREIRSGIWKREANRGTELMGKTIGIIGYGYMGQAFARRLQGFGVEVLAYDKYRHHYTDSYARQADMEEIFETTDVLSLHVPLTEETRFMLNEDYLNRFSKNIFLLNTARGKNISLKTLVSYLENGKLLGAALDVLENEKLATLTEEQKHWFERLVQMENVIITPHVGGWTHESYEKINQVLVNKIKGLY
ncbi:MAG: 2-hydroxyacid dehydrogenase [Cyclobacteriaceae bacterium]